MAIQKNGTPSIFFIISFTVRQAGMEKTVHMLISMDYSVIYQ